MCKKTSSDSGYDNLSPIFPCESLRRMTVRGWCMCGQMIEIGCVV